MLSRASPETSVNRRPSSIRNETPEKFIAPRVSRANGYYYYYTITSLEFNIAETIVVGCKAPKAERSYLVDNQPGLQFCRIFENNFTHFVHNTVNEGGRQAGAYRRGVYRYIYPQSVYLNFFYVVVLSP